MRIALICCVVVCVACSGTGGPAASNATSPPASSRAANGGIIEYSVPTVDPTCQGCLQEPLGGIVAGSDGNIWFGDPNQNKVGRITPAGVVTEFDVPGQGFRVPSMTRAGPNVWMAAQGAGGESTGWIVRITPAGAVARFPIPAAPRAVAAGADGSIWFTQGYGGSTLGRLTPSGTYSTFQLPEPGAEPTGLVAGRDGYLWLVESTDTNAVIARVATTGAGKTFPLDQVPASYSPQSIAVGSDGNIWVGARGEIDRVTPAGAFTSFALPTPSADVSSLTAGPDGNLWFTDGSSNAVGRITVKGTVREFAVPPSASPWGVAAGSDGRVWFVESGARIGSIGVTVPVPWFSSRILNFSAAPTTAQVVTVQNTGDGRLDISALKVGGPGAAAFRVVSDDCSGHTVSPGKSCSLTVSAAPATEASGAYLELYDNATASPQHLYVVEGLAACALPVSAPPDPTMTFKAGFFDATTGAYRDDPNAAFSYDSDPNLYHSIAKPVLTGDSLATYDRPAGRWIPAWPGAITPDGSTYAYTSSAGIAPNSSVHVVDVATGRDRTLNLPMRSWIIRSFAPEGIYLDVGYERLAPGLWLVNPDTGALAMVLTQGQVTAVGDGAAWLSSRNPADLHPPVEGNGQLGNNEVVRYDLRTGATSTWLYTPGVDVGVQMVAGKTVVVGAVREGVGSMLMMTAPNVTQPLVSPETGEDFWAIPSAAATTEGIWIPGRSGHLYLWTQTSGLILVADTPEQPAGACA